MRQKIRIRAAAGAMALALLLNSGCAMPGRSTVSDLLGSVRSEVENAFGTGDTGDTGKTGETGETGETGTQTAAENPAAGAAQTGQNTEAGTVQETDQGTAGAATQYDTAGTQYADADRYPYYAQLSDNEKTVYLQIVEQVSAGNADITPAADLNGDELEAVVSAVYREQPQLFWLENAWNWSSYEITGIVASITMTFNELADNLEANIAAFQAAGEAARQNLAGLSDAEKELAIHDYLAANTNYERNDLDQNAYSALVNHSSVCCGFTRAFQYLLQCEGIPAYFCQGTASGFTESESGNDHAWNIVKLGDGYYNVDVTWDETSLSAQGMIVYNYFNRTDEAFGADHFRDASSEFLPACTAEECSYEALRGVPAELGVTAQMDLTDSTPIYSLEEYYQRMQNAVAAAGLGTHTFSYIVCGDDCMAQISEAISSNAIQEGFMNSAAAAIGMNGYSSSLSCQEMDLGGGYHYLSQTVVLNTN